jgi:DNA-binding beta-propeller fold protein YncE
LAERPFLPPHNEAGEILVKKIGCLFAVAFLPLLLQRNSAQPSASEPRAEVHRSPADVAVLADGRFALSANQTADSVSLIDLTAGKVIAELRCGHKPAAVACSRDGRHAAVCNLWTGTVSLFGANHQGLSAVAEVAVGHMPCGLALSPDGERLYVAVSGADQVVQLDWSTRKVLCRWAAPGEPRRLALSRDGRFLAAACGRSGEVRCWDTRSEKLLWAQGFNDAFNLHGLTFTADDKSLVTTHVHDHHHAITRSNIENGWALNSRLGRLDMGTQAPTETWQIALDIRNKAVGDPCAVATSVQGKWLAVAAAGTQELLIYQASEILWGGEPSDFLDSRLAVDEGKFRRLPLGGRPLAVHFLADSSQAVVANYLLDAVQVVDVAAGKLVRSIPLGGPAQPSLTRRGAAIFYDAKRSHHQWFSCHTCHPDGHTSCRTFDTLNDGGFGNAKLTPTLRGVTKTGPWTWHGWQTDLGCAVEKSLRDTLCGPKPSIQDVEALRAFLATLDNPPNPNLRPDGSLSASAERGQTLFHGKAHCASCHRGDYYTSSRNYDVKVEPDGSAYPLWNPPSLRGLCDRGPYLHEGQAETLDEVLGVFHAPEKLGGAALTPEERQDLIEFLKSL